MTDPKDVKPGRLVIHKGIIYDIRVDAAECDRRVGHLIAALWPTWLSLQGEGGRATDPRRGTAQK